MQIKMSVFFWANTALRAKKRWERATVTCKQWSFDQVMNYDPDFREIYSVLAVIGAQSLKVARLIAIHHGQKAAKINEQGTFVERVLEKWAKTSKKSNDY